MEKTEVAALVKESKFLKYLEQELKGECRILNPHYLRSPFYKTHIYPILEISDELDVDIEVRFDWLKEDGSPLGEEDMIMSHSHFNFNVPMICFEKDDVEIFTNWVNKTYLETMTRLHENIEQYTIALHMLYKKKLPSSSDFQIIE